MPLQRCSKNGIRGWRWGNSGACYVGKNAKTLAIRQALAIGKGKIPTDYYDSEESRTNFKQVLLHSRLNTTRKLKTKKRVPRWIYPSQYERAYRKFISSLMGRFKNITVGLSPDIEEWNREQKQITDNVLVTATTTFDAWPDELERIRKEEYERLQNQIFSLGEEDLKAELFSIFFFVNAFNSKQFSKLNKSVLGIEWTNWENWNDTIAKAWVDRNVNLIKGLSDEYIKKINDAIMSGLQRGLSIVDLKRDLLKINRNFTSYRSNLIARDQINKINGQLTRQRQLDAGIETYYWLTAGDRRVRPSHAAMAGRLCRWDDPTVFSPDNGKTWISRASIGGVMLHPQEDILCRCIGEPNYNPLIEEVNITQENLLG